jgi:hypothetical protein
LTARRSSTFPFALSYGATRRDYWLGSSVTFELLSAMYAIGITLLGVIERATDGWGLGGHMFTPIYFGDVWWQRRLIFFFFGLLFFFFVGSAIAAVWVRWNVTGVGRLLHRAGRSAVCWGRGAHSDSMGRIRVGRGFRWAARDRVLAAGPRRDQRRGRLLHPAASDPARLNSVRLRSTRPEPYRAPGTP